MGWTSSFDSDPLFQIYCKILLKMLQSNLEVFLYFGMFCIYIYIAYQSRIRIFSQCLRNLLLDLVSSHKSLVRWRAKMLPGDCQDTRMTLELAKQCFQGIFVWLQSVPRFVGFLLGNHSSFQIAPPRKTTLQQSWHNKWKSAFDNEKYI